MNKTRKRKQKHNNKKTLVDGILFDSKLEAQRYLVLKQAQEDGIISRLERQTRYILLPSQLGIYKRERPVTYKADFTYVKDGVLVVEDVKSKITIKKPDYIIKRKLMLWVNGVSIKEVLTENVGVI